MERLAGGPGRGPAPAPHPNACWDQNLDTHVSKKDQLAKEHGKKEGSLPDSKRQACGDISNRPPLQHLLPGDRGFPAADKVASRPAFATKLHASAFCDPDLIDAGNRHAERCKPKADWVDIDQQNLDDPQACSAYAEAIFKHLREAELMNRPNPKHLEQVQNDMNAKMRAILVDWLVEVSEEYRLCADTLYQAINYLDRFLSVYTARRCFLQLIGVTCMWLASKYEELYPPNVADYGYITDNTFCKEQLITMEEIVLKKLDYKLTVPTAKTFLRRLLQVCNPDESLHFLSNYLCEISLLDYNMLSFLPSVIAAAGIYLANLMLKRQPWGANLRHYSTYLPSDISHCILALAAVHQAVGASQSLASIRTKYAGPKFHQVSMIPGVAVTLDMIV